jgi:hypothetical protein
MLVPARACLPVESEGIAQVLEGPRVLERLRVRDDHQREPPDAGASGGVGGKQRRVRVHLFQVLQDRERLRESDVAVDQQRNAALGVLGAIGICELFAGPEIDEHVLTREALPLERDPHPVARR